MRNFFDHDNALHVYYVGLYKNITKAADKLNLTQSAMSRRIQCAEERTGIQIFERRFHNMYPTPEGQKYIKACEKVVHIGDAVIKDVHKISAKVPQALSIISSPSLAATMIPAMVKGYDSVQDGITLSIKGTTDPLTIVGNDVAIGPYIEGNDDLVQIKLYQQIQHLYASQDYVDKNGEPQSIADLAHHKLLAIDPDKYANFRDANWLLTHEISDSVKTRKPFMVFDSNDSKIRAMSYGYGIASSSEFHLKLLGINNAVKILPNIKDKGLGVYFIYNKLAEEVKQVHDLYDVIQKNLRNFLDHKDK